MKRLLENLRVEFSADIISTAGDSYRHEPRGRYQSPTLPLARPRTVKQVAAIVRYCNTAGIGIIPYAGGTGLVCGQLNPDAQNCIVLSVERLNQCRASSARDNIIIAEAGMILSDLHATAEKIDRLFPLSLAAQGTARIGGILATNAGGVQVLRYGCARDLCLGLEAVLPDGEIYHGLKRLRKDNMGYNLNQLLIGAEGTLGIITAAALKVFTRPQVRIVAMLAIDSPADALVLFEAYQNAFTDSLSAFELIKAQGLEFVTRYMPKIKYPFDTIAPWSLLIECTAPAQAQLEERMLSLLEQQFKAGLLLDARIAQSNTQCEQLWALRELIPSANRMRGAICSHDIALPI